MASSPTCPSTLYKYAPIDGAEKIIRTRSLWWTKPSLFNDLFDCDHNWLDTLDAPDTLEGIAEVAANIVFASDPLPRDVSPGLREIATAIRSGRLPKSRDQFRAEIRSILPKSMATSIGPRQQLLAAIAEVIDKSRILCLCDAPDNELMWTHYADANRGVVFGFDMAIGSPWQKLARPVSYSDVPPVFLDPDEWGRTIFFNAPLNNSAIAQRLYTTKRLHWQYEREWRCVYANSTLPSQDKNGRLPVLFEPEQFLELRFGVRTTPEDQRRILAVLNIEGMSPKLLRGIANRSSRRIDFEPCGV